MAEGRRPFVVYREVLANPSEPYVTAQAEGMLGHVAHYLGIRPPAAGTAPPADRLVPWSDGPLGGARRYLWKQFGFAPRTTRALGDLRPALVHAHFGRDAAQLLPFVDRSGVPLVVTYHGHDATRLDADLRAGSWSDRLYLRRRAALASTAARHLPVSSFLAAQLRDRGFPDDRLAVHYLGVDVAAIREVATTAGPREHDLVLYVGRLVEQKGVEDVVDAVAELRRSGTAVRLVVIGDGPLRGALEARAGGVTFLGSQPSAGVWAWMARASVVVVPSRVTADGRAEGYGLVATEAHAAGAVVIATATGGLPEAVAPVMQDLLVPPHDPHSIAARLATVMAGGDRWVQARADAAAWVTAHRDLVRQRSRLEEIYFEVAPR